MKLLVVSHKPCWAQAASPAGSAGVADPSCVTVGGFAIQMRVLAELFAETRLLITRRAAAAPRAATRLEGPGLGVHALPEPRGAGWRRKLDLIRWLMLHLRTIWREVAAADAVHALVPGDVGTIGLLVALAQRKPLFVRHCGTWGHERTLADRALARLLPRIAGGRTVVMATGGADALPCPSNPSVTWIFSTSLSREEIAVPTRRRPWAPGQPLRLIQVGRLTPGKNVTATLRALAEIRLHGTAAQLDVVGDGADLEELKSLASELGLCDVVTFHGNVGHETVMDLLREAHLFLFPTRVREGFPKAVLEAMACGVPIVVPRVSVLPRLVHEGGGAVVESTTPEDLASAVLDLMARPEDLAAMAARARAAAGLYTLERWRDAIRARLEAAWGGLPVPRPIP